jgi:predicted Rdx family selenoprotein
VHTHALTSLQRLLKFLHKRDGGFPGLRNAAIRDRVRDKLNAVRLTHVFFTRKVEVCNLGGLE